MDIISIITYILAASGILLLIVLIFSFIRTKLQKIEPDEAEKIRPALPKRYYKKPAGRPRRKNSEPKRTVGKRKTSASRKLRNTITGFRRRLTKTGPENYDILDEIKKKRRKGRFQIINKSRRKFE